MEQTKKCRKCGRELPLSKFSKSSKNRDGLYIYCKECKAEYMREYNARKRLEKKSESLPTPSRSVQRNPKYADKSPRELQDELRELKTELIARGFHCEVDLTYLHKIKI